MRFLKHVIIAITCFCLFALLMIGFVGWGTYKLFKSEKTKRDRVKQLPEASGILTSKTPLQSPFDSTSASILYLDVSYNTKGSRGGPYHPQHIFQYAPNLQFVIDNKTYNIVVPPDYKAELYPELYFPEMTNGERYYLSNHSDYYKSHRDQISSIPPKLLGINETLDCALLNFTLQHKDCSFRYDGYTSLKIEESFYPNNKRVTLKGKISSGNFVLLN